MESGNITTTTTDDASKELDRSFSNFEAMQLNSAGTPLTSPLSTRSTQRWRLLSRAVRSKTYELFEDEGATTASGEMPSSGISSAGSSSSGLSYPYFYPYRTPNESLKPSTVSTQQSSNQHNLSPPVSPESAQGDSDNDVEYGLGGSSCPSFKISSTSVSANVPPSPQQQQPYGFNIKTYGFMKYAHERTPPTTTSGSETCANIDECANLNERWIKCKWNVDVIDNSHQMEKCQGMSLQLKLVENRLTFQDLAGFDNSGNVRIWPCEELLTYLVTFGVLKDKVENKVVLEIGAGMTALAGLTLAYLNACRRLYLTDGNRRCVKNIDTIVDRNFERIVEPAKQCATTSTKLTLAKETVHVQQLRWGIVSDYQHLRGKIEVIIGADILFVSHSHADLLNTIDALLVEQAGSAFLLAPRRGNTLQEWIDLVRKDGRFSINMFESFCTRFASIYQELYKQNPHGWNHDAYFPFLLVMTRSSSHLCDQSRASEPSPQSPPIESSRPAADPF